MSALPQLEPAALDAHRVAVIVVHGVADQRPGDTARAVVDLLVGAAPPGIAYAATSTETCTLAVEPLPPAAARTRTLPPTPTASSRPFLKSLVQSGRSDFQRAGWEAPGTLAALRDAVTSSHGSAPPGSDPPPRAQRATRTTEHVPAPSTERVPAPSPASDRGLDATRFLLAKFIDNGGARESYETNCITLTRQSAGATQRVDLYEMYWADLSRLGGAMPRIVTELFTMVFRLSKLGRETVDEARRDIRGADGRTPASWQWFANTQIALDWAFVNGLALLFAQLGLLALVIVGFGFVAPHQEGLRIGVGAGVLVASLLWLAYRWRDRALRRALPAALAVAAAAMLLHAPSAFWILGVFWLGLITLGYDAALRVADDRFPLTRVPGLALWGIALVLTVGAALWRVATQPEAPTLGVWVQAALLGVEAALAAIKWWWVLAGPLFIAWLVAGTAAARHGGYQGSASVATGRLGFFVSLGTFMMLTMALWALLSSVLGLAAAGLDYAPLLFAPAEIARGVSDATAAAGSCPWNAPAVAAAPASPIASTTAAALPAASSAVVFLRLRYEDSTSFFALVAALLLLLVAYLAAMFVPSILAELKLLTARARRRGAPAVAPAAATGVFATSATSATTAVPTALPVRDAPDSAARRLGRWLTAGYRRLDGAVLVVVAAGIVLAAAVGYLFVFGRGALESSPWFGPAAGCVAWVSQAALKPLLFGAAGIAAALTALGGLLSRYLPGLRAPLDIALDIDNYFREFPRRSIPRARIFARYAALLQHVAQQGYERIVIVSHSQGTVISADLLRFLSSANADAADAPDSTADLTESTETIDTGGTTDATDATHANAIAATGSAGATGATGATDTSEDIGARALRLRELLGADVRLLTLGCPLRQLYAARFPSLYRWVLAAHGGANGPTAGDLGVERWANAYTSGDYVGRWLWSSPAAAGNALGRPMTDTVHPALFGRSDAYAPFAPMPPTATAFAAAREFELCLGLGAHTHYFEPDQADVAWLIDHLIASRPLPAA